MAISWDDFDKIWASTSPLTPYSFSDNNYKQGWNFVGATPPARQMWDFLQKQNDEKFKFLRDNFGTPNMVTTAAQMTDTDKIYVYVGSEAGWNNGHWYYYDAGTSTWVDGGVYNSTAFVTDATLTEAGKAADAKAVGDALALKADLAGATFTGNVVVNADFSTTGNATIANDLTVSGKTTLTGNISATDVTASGDITAGSLTVSGDSTFNSPIFVQRVTSGTGNITAGADITVNGDISADDVTANGNLSVVGNVALNGTSTAVTPAEADNSTNIATTAYVQGELTNYLPLSGGTVTGGLTVEGTITGNLEGNADTATNATNDANGSPIAGTYLPLSGGTLTGVVNGVTPTAGDNSKKIATTEFVNAKVGEHLNGLKFSVTAEGLIHVELDSDDEE